MVLFVNNCSCKITYRGQSFCVAESNNAVVPKKYSLYRGRGSGFRGALEPFVVTLASLASMRLDHVARRLLSFWLVIAGLWNVPSDLRG